MNTFFCMICLFFLCEAYTINAGRDKRYAANGDCSFSVLLVTVLVHLFYIFHRFFVGSMALVLYLFYQYIAILVEEETGKPRRLDVAALRCPILSCSRSWKTVCFTV